MGIDPKRLKNKHKVNTETFFFFYIRTDCYEMHNSPESDSSPPSSYLKYLK